MCQPNRYEMNSDQYLSEMAQGHNPIRFITFADGTTHDIPNVPYQQHLSILAKLDMILALLQAGGGAPPLGPVTVAAESVAEIATATTDELAQRLAS
jgi:hypothetical protein